MKDTAFSGQQTTQHAFLILQATVDIMEPRFERPRRAPSCAGPIVKAEMTQHDNRERKQRGSYVQNPTSSTLGKP